MARLLYIESSPRKKRSSSIEVARLFIEEYQKSHPHDEVFTIDLWYKEIPQFDGDVIDAKYAIMHGQSHTEAQRKAWRAVEQTIAEFKSADKYLFSIPMWNFSIPYKLKHYIDVLVQPSYVFTYSPSEGYKGLIVNKPVTLIYSRMGSYESGTESEQLDMQKKYMESILGFIGFNDFRSIIIQPTATAEQKAEAVKKGKEQAVQIANQF